MILAPGAQQGAIDQNKCLHKRIRKVNCQKCQAACPRQSLRVKCFNREAFITRTDSCNGCGLCVSACPAGAITLVQKPLNLEVKNGMLELVCSKHKAESSLGCLGMLDAYGFAYLGLKAEQVVVRLDPERCAQCNPGIIAAVRQRIKQANAVLCKLGRQAIQLALRSGETDKKLNRRELFAFCFSLARETLLEMLPLSLNQGKTYRELLIDFLNQQSDLVAEDLSPLFFGGKVHETCNLCGSCVRSCKNGALTFTNVGANGYRQILHNQSKCIGCMACTLLCPQSALQIAPELSDARIVAGRLPVVLTSKKCCSRCGKDVADAVVVCELCLQTKTPYLQSIY